MFFENPIPKAAGFRVRCGRRMTEKIRKVLSFPSPVPAKADYQRVKSSYSVREIKQLFGLSERTVRRWTESGIIQGTPVGETGDFTYDFQALTLFRRVREMRTQGLTIKQIEAELQGQMSLFRPEGRQVRVARLHYEAAAQIEPNFSLVYYNLALVYHRLTNVAAATQALHKYKELEPGDEEIELVDQILKALEAGRPGK